MRCGFCYASLDEGQGRTITSADALFASAWVCADEDSCWERQDYNDWLYGREPRRRTRWLMVTATTPDGELVL